jgi:hypothetical protein
MFGFKVGHLPSEQRKLAFVMVVHVVSPWGDLSYSAAEGRALALSAVAEEA